MKQKVMKKGGKKLANRLIPGTVRSTNPSQVISPQKLQGPSQIVATQAVTALLDTAYIAPSLNSLTSASSWKGLFDEYRILGIKFIIEPVTLANGVTKFVMDDEDTTSPSSSWMNSRIGTILCNNSSYSKSHAVLKYRCQDIDDLQWKSTASEATYTPMALKMYTSLSGYGSPTSTNLWWITYILDVEFRGIGANA